MGEVPGVPSMTNPNPAATPIDDVIRERLLAERDRINRFFYGDRRLDLPSDQRPRSHPAPVPNELEPHAEPAMSLDHVTDEFQAARFQNLLDLQRNAEDFGSLTRLFGPQPTPVEPQGRLKNRGGYIDLTGKGKPNEPETIVAPAYRSKDGRVFTGAVHVLAHEEARRVGAIPPNDGPGGGQDGFLTSTGRFVSRREAMQLHERATGLQGQDELEPGRMDALDLPPSQRAKIDATEVTPRELEPFRFDQNRFDALDALDLPTNQRARIEAAEVKPNEPSVKFKSYGQSSNPNAVTGRLTAPDDSWTIMLDPTEASKIPGLRGEEGRIRGERVNELVTSMRERGFDPDHAVAIDVVNGQPRVYEGNHRIRAAAELGLPVPAEVRFIGNTSTKWRPVLAGQKPSEWRLKNRPGFLNLGGGKVQLPNRTEGTGTPYQAPVDVTENERALANIGKLDLSPEAEAKVRDAYARLGLEKKHVTHEETRAVADELGLDPARLLDKQGRLSGAELLAVRDVVSSNAQRIVDLSAQAQQPTLGVGEKEALLQEIGQLTAQNDEFLRRYTRQREQTGRDLNALKIIARNSLDAPTWLLQAERLKGLPLTQDEHVLISQLAAAKDRDGLIKMVAGLRRSTPQDKLITLWKAGLLTSLGTHEANMAGNAAMAVAESVKDVPAALVDALLSLARGTERTKAPSVRGLVVEPVKGLVGPGFRAARRVLKYGAHPAELGKWDFRKTNYGDGPAGRFAQAYTDVVFNTLGAEDQLFRAAAVGRSLEEQARLLAKKDKALLKQLRKDPTPAMMVQAIADAEVAVFQNDNLAATGVSSLRQGLRAKGKVGETAAAATEVVAPFVKTPSNIVARTIEYSPPGLALNSGRLVKALVKGVTAPDQKQLAESLGRGIVGSSTLFLLGFMLAREGKATGSAPKEAKERSQWELEGKIPNGVRIGNTWRSFSRMGPPGMLVATGAQAYDAFANSETASGKIFGALYAPVRAGLDQSFLQGVSGALDALNDPVRAGERFMESTAGSVIPSGIAQIARAADPYARERSGVAQAVQARIPGLRNELPAKLNVFGKPVREGGPVSDFFDPTRPTPASTDPLVMALEKADASVGFPSRTVTGPDRTRRKLTDEEYRALIREVGPKTESALRELLKQGLFSDSRETPEDRRDAVQHRITQVRSAASKRRRQRESQTATTRP